ncbi:P1 family peptidase [Octadecabacter sp. 1_MG-2023]|uniref:P1 family peptidase n=1 Tax=unclassified Octadecabacter TaxID=196158 RepID=UPI001C08D911|nr:MULTISPECIES: P1 family peptidase [unclassified Octadecabacter]MBU2992044.1 P1 family peptidase [Octadecabacter sp. B2R22]MDO6736019.1 P1 family peptidase [Octadecabacter sp. 1_MG-2023]
MTYAPGPRNLITDVAGLRVGNAQDHQLKSGSTVLVADSPFTASVHVMGGAPGTRETDLLAPDKTVQQVDALVLSGGSAFGLDACSGVAAGLRDKGRGFAVGDVTVPIVPGAIVFDLINGGDKDWDVNPYAAFGRAALDTAGEDFTLGSHGAGTGAMAARQMGGLGSASVVLPDGTTVGALVVVNSLGSVTTSGDRHFWAAPFEMDNEFGGLGPDPAAGYTSPDPSLKEQAMGLHATRGANTTIAIVATDAPLSKVQCHRLAVMAHDGMARAIVPSHTPLDGDLVFGVSTNDDPPVDVSTFAAIGAAGATCLSRAIARAIYEATPAEGDLIPTYR